MRSKNAVSLIGTVGKDAEVRTTQQGVQFARFSLATSTGGYKKQDGTDVPEQTQWHNIVCWRNLADIAGKYIKKGMKLDVEGMITYGEYTDQQGVKKTSVEIVASDMVMMSAPPANNVSQGQQQNNNRQQQGGYQQPANNGGYQQQNNGYNQQQNQGGYQRQGNAGGYNQPNNGYQQQGNTQPFPPQQNNEIPF